MFNRIKQRFFKVPRKKQFYTHPKNNKAIKNTHDYFSRAQSWSDDFYATAVASRNRWRAMSLFGLAPLLGLSLISIVLLIPNQHLEPLLINHYPDNVVTVMPATQPVIPMSMAEVQSDIVRYVINRESYSAFSYQTQYELIMLLSSDSVADDYANQQASSNPNAPINVLKSKGVQTAQVTSVLFLDSVDKNEPAKHITHHQNLAQVNFTVTTTFSNGVAQTTPYTALVSWVYNGTPADPTEAWQNWNGFRVTQFQVEQRQVSN